jgi:ABC-type dipeptide/oligopeptide/nickel transport system permease subunit
VELSLKFIRPSRRRPPRLYALAILILSFVVVFALVTVPFWASWYDVQSLDAAVRHAPSISPVVPLEHYTPEAGPLIRAGHLLTSSFGHDDLGRSLLYRVLPAFLISMTVGLCAAAISLVIGVSWGATAALMGGRVDAAMMRMVDVLYGLPYILLVILLQVGLSRPLSAVLQSSHRANLIVLLLAIGAVSWLTMARVVRGQVLSLKHQPFVEAARTAGAGPMHILLRHLLPNLWGPVAAYAALVVPQAILQESFLSFLGLGIQPPTPSLGRLAAEGVEAVNTFVGYWWLIVFPCGMLIVALVSLNIVADALRDRFDRKSTALPLA